MICPHVITEHAEDAATYCQICAPQYITSLRARIEVLEKVAKKISDHPEMVSMDIMTELRAALDALKEG